MWEINQLLNIDPYDFERLVAHLFDKMGYNTRSTQQSRDGGVDIEISIDNFGLSHRWLVQAKRYSGPVGVKEVREYGSLSYRENVDGVIIVTTSSFTGEGRKEGAKHNLKLIEGPLLTEMLNHYCPDEGESFHRKGRGVDVLETGEEVFGRHSATIEGNKIWLVLTKKHIYFEKITATLFSKKKELIRRIDASSIIGLKQDTNSLYIVIDEKKPEVLTLHIREPKSFAENLELFRPSFLRGETLLKFEKEKKGCMVLTNRRFLMMDKGNTETIRLKDIAGAEIEKQGILHKDKLAILESKESITRHIYDVENASEWREALLKGLGKE